MESTANATAIAIVALLIPAAFSAPAPAENTVDNEGPATLAISGGNAGFYVETNVPAVSVKGKSGVLQGSVQVRRTGDGLLLEHFEALLPVKSLATGMGVRDEHMRKYIFTTSDGKVPDLNFEGDKVTCPGAASAKETTCEVTGALAIRGVPRKFTASLKIRKEGASGFHAVGEGTVKLSDYGIEQPSQFGVKTANEVAVHLEFSVKPGTAVTASAGGKR